MGNLDFAIKNHNSYKLGINAGFFAAFLLLASVFYFVIAFFKEMPSVVKYYHVVLFVVITYLIGFIIMKFKK